MVKIGPVVIAHACVAVLAGAGVAALATSRRQAMHVGRRLHDAVVRLEKLECDQRVSNALWPSGDSVMRFRTLGDAAVLVFERGGDPQRYGWRCLGCGSCADTDTPLTEDKARESANDHAGRCRSMS